MNFPMLHTDIGSVFETNNIRFYSFQSKFTVPTNNESVKLLINASF